ncbi:hypothetical protein AVEN_146325-1 [Araneus ventricosus]|uniref:Uncharacterized protein n=1 Tax=Araneus ventricosus TaxID=182803 RepID=A0A4Y2J883_ARAVE|nr:hypothetical protein AVEN_146325-1 [Araneus ventricosus]
MSSVTHRHVFNKGEAGKRIFFRGELTTILADGRDITHSCSRNNHSKTYGTTSVLKEFTSGNSHRCKSDDVSTITETKELKELKLFSLFFNFWHPKRLIIYGTRSVLAKHIYGTRSVLAKHIYGTRSVLAKHIYGTRSVLAEHIYGTRSVLAKHRKYFDSASLPRCFIILIINDFNL